MFTNTPLTVETLVTRLRGYQFWNKSTLELSIARNAIKAAKYVALERDRVPSHALQTSKSLGLLSRYDPHRLLEDMYKYPPVVKHFSKLWRDLLLMKPQPSLYTQIQLIHNDRSPEIVAGALRTALAQKDFIAAFAFVDLVRPKKFVQVFGLPILLTTWGLCSATVWLASPWLATALAIFWTGLAGQLLPSPKQPLVEFDRLRTTFLFRFLNSEKLKLANMILTSFKETGSVNVDNYHRQDLALSNHFMPEGTKLVSEIEAELRKRGMRIQKQLSFAERNYADYWSPSVDKWQRVEWQEPDQDPAEALRKH